MTKNKDIYNVTFTSFDEYKVPEHLKNKIKYHNKPIVSKEQLDEEYVEDINTGEFMKKSVYDASYSGDPEYSHTNVYPDSFMKALENSRKKYEEQFQPDSIVQSIINKFNDRAKMGKEKYNNTLDRNDFTVVEWINNAQEELMDGILYLEKLKKTLGGK
jgi:hypothetical protein